MSDETSRQEQSAPSASVTNHSDAAAQAMVLLPGKRSRPEDIGATGVSANPDDARPRTPRLVGSEPVRRIVTPRLPLQPAPSGPAPSAASATSSALIEPDPRQLSFDGMPAEPAATVPVVVPAEPAVALNRASRKLGRPKTKTKNATPQASAPVKAAKVARESVREAPEPVAKRQRRATAAPALSRHAVAAASSPEDAAVEEQFRRYALRIGADRAQALLSQIFEPFLD